MNDLSPRRSGGRAARRAARAAALPEDVQPIKAGMSGGTYKPMSDADVKNIHNAALTALEEIGLADAPASGVQILTDAGAIQSDDGRIRFPRALVEDMVDQAAKTITLCGRDPKHDMILEGNRVHYGTAGAAVNMVDIRGNEYRDSTVQDLHDAAKIVQQMDNVHFLQRPMVCRDI
ncbi:MAG: trimethylamine methyltransferase family protein, partial [Pseudomonadota bacterium]